MVKKLLNWIFKGENTLGFILFILIIPLYIIFFGRYVNENTTNFLLSVAAIFSTVLLYLALRENWKANHLKTIEPKFNDLLGKVKYFEARSVECLFSKPYSISSIVYYPGDLISNISASNFLKLVDLYNAIRVDTRYQFCIEKLGNNDQVNIENSEKVTEIDIVMSQLIEGYRNLWHFHFNISFLFSEIEKSDLLFDQKKYLIERIASSYKHFSQFYNNMMDTKSRDYLMYENFYNFKIFKLFENRSIGLYETDLQWKFVFMTCKEIEEVLRKYHNKWI